MCKRRLANGERSLDIPYRILEVSVSSNPFNAKETWRASSRYQEIALNRLFAGSGDIWPDQACLGFDNLQICACHGNNLSR